MGCDIHLYTEKLRDGVWLNCDNWKINHYYDPNDKEDSEREWSINYLYHDRDYYLFSVLANVRNYGLNKFISEPRGLPRDVSLQTKAESDGWDADGHSHSYFTLFELKEFRNKNTTTKFSGLVSLEDALKLDAGEGFPSSWCQGSSDKTKVQRTWEIEESHLDELIELLDGRMREEFWIWDDKDYPKLEKRVRIVFWFDN